ncbi:hypothetical protein HYC85_002067 [Camellia sinensis]|uniref:C2H2-type domain-containing protein n=1 Tax=Camellia sinensis TaxID=4442 RepID=A0A7J7I9K9_CAMSI|nr:hypothetical protein HYC85_002067 [Camellia sinensis]
MTNPHGKDSTTNPPPNTSEAPSPRRVGEGPSNTSPPASGQELETPRPNVAGTSVRPSRQPVLGAGGHVGEGGGVGDTTSVGGESTSGGVGVGMGMGMGMGGVSTGMEVLQIEATAGGGGGVGSQRKRTREGMDAGEGSSAGQGGEAPPPQGVFRCFVCGRDDFLNHHSLGGHLRTHPERSWKGAFPPPVFSREEFGDVLGLVGGAGAGAGQAAEVVVAAPPPVQREGGESRDQLDLNALPTADEEEPTPTPPNEEEPPPPSSIKLVQDLNKLPPPEED